MIKAARLFIVLIFLFSLASCHWVCTEGKGPLESDKRSIDGAKSIALNLDAEVTVIKGERPVINIQAHENLIPKITTDVSGGQLEISSDGCLSSDERIRILVTLPELEGLTVNGSGDFYVSDTFAVKDVELEIRGSGNINAKFVAAQIESSIKGSGSILLAGSANKQDIGIYGSGSVNAQSMPCNEATIKVNGSGDTWVYAIQNLDIKVNGSGTAHYKGKPSVRTQINGSGKVVDDN